MSQHTSGTSLAPLRYHSTYLAPIFDSGGSFQHFDKRVDIVHVQNGYWKFPTVEDERRAYELGLNNPEAILIAQDVGDGTYDSIMLRWVPGELDPINKPSVGSAAVHLETIYNERRMLGKTLSFRGQVPLYPISSDPRLLKYRLTRYGIQKGALHHNTLLSSSVRSSLQVPPTPSATPEESIWNSSDRAFGSASSVLQDNRPSQAEDTPVSISQSHSKLVLSYSKPPVQSSASTRTTRLPNTDGDTAAVEDARRSITSRNFHPEAFLPSPIPNEHTPLKFSSNSESTRHFDIDWEGDQNTSIETGKLGDEDAAAIQRAGDWLTEAPVDDDLGPALTDVEQIRTYEARVAALPCMECGCIDSHAPECCIAKATPSMFRPVGELGSTEIRVLAEATERFDPAPWTTHHVYPTEEVEEESIETQIRGMAEIIRGFDDYAEDPDLHMLDDHNMVLLWALKGCGEVHVLRD
ncbi:hypothetical protein B5807_11516 [Epicoccum nigrum]|jgi:hypothetical protein|uniref:Uncharacterized protein n=1 Tax=Epicoccum nigrum TaxID=105696 RepID=A0A1Y2LIW9_EPING|nr:hypothetical protein B5807_11516 [Epicoccum nigrum]